MATNATQSNERIDTIDERDERALEQYLTVLPDQGEVRNSPGQALVVSESGNEYLVDAVHGACECWDDRRDDRPRCKHRRRVEFATGQRAIPAAAVSRLDVDPSLGEHCDGDLRFATADGGIVAAGGDDEPEPDDVDDECDCSELPDGVPCAECYIAGDAEWEA